MKQHLKRCPFCNSHNLTIDITSLTASIRCVDCGAMGPTGTTENNAVVWWNGESKHQNDSAMVVCKWSNRNQKKEIEL